MAYIIPDCLYSDSQVQSFILSLHLHCEPWCHMADVGANWRTLVPTGGHWCQLEDIGANWRTLVPTGGHWCHMSDVGATWRTLVPHVRRWCHMADVGATCQTLVPQRGDYSYVAALLHYTGRCTIRIINNNNLFYIQKNIHQNYMCSRALLHNGMMIGILRLRKLQYNAR